MKQNTLLLLLCCVALHLSAQELQVRTLAENIDASGGVTVGPEGHIYVSDFGPDFGKTDSTSVYKVDRHTFEVSLFATGFKGASGACFDSKGNFYQSNPHGGQVSKVFPDGRVVYDFATQDIQLPVGIVADSRDQLFVCDCKANTIRKIQADGTTELFAESADFNCPNGLTITGGDTLYVVNFNNGKVQEVTPEGKVRTIAELPTLQGGPQPVGNGHIAYANGWLWVTCIGKGTVYRVARNGTAEQIAGSGAFTNSDGPALEAGFSKPNGIAVSCDGDALFINVSDPSWISNPGGLHPAHLKMVTGLCGLKGVDCGDCSAGN